jgi:hypothetical protein
MSYEQVRAFIATAFERNAPFLALDQALQFEGMFRQTDVRGHWRKAKPNEVPGPGEVQVSDRFWRGITMDIVWIKHSIQRPVLPTTIPNFIDHKVLPARSDAGGRRACDADCAGPDKSGPSKSTAPAAEG